MAVSAVMAAVSEGTALAGKKGATVTSGSSLKAIVSDSEIRPAIATFLVAE
jgi:hypothetical protein